MSTNPKIIFFGTFEYAAHSLKSLLEENFSITGVVTNPDSLQGRKKELAPTPVKLVAQAHGLNIIQPEKIKNNLEFFDRLKSLEPDLGIVVAYSKILPKEIIEMPKFGTINIHPSLLPAYRGPSPVQSAVLNGEMETGVTIMQIDQEVDHGPILAQAKYPIPTEAYYPQVTHELFELGTELLIQTIPDWIEGKVALHQQDHSQATFTRKFSREDGRIDWSEPAEKIYHQIRALNPEPGTWTTYSGKILKILKASLSEGSTLDLQKGRTLVLEEVQLEGKKIVSYQDFLRGIGQKEINFE